MERGTLVYDTYHNDNRFEGESIHFLERPVSSSDQPGDAAQTTEFAFQQGSSKPLEGHALKSPVRQLLLTWLLTFSTSVWLGFTILFAYNSTLGNPLSSKLLFPAAGQTVTALTLLSHVSILLLQFVTSNVFESVRWALAGSRGISAFGFVTLSRATSPLGVLSLLPFSSKTATHVVRDHRFWGIQR
jgi:hypothetical protein